MGRCWLLLISLSLQLRRYHHKHRQHQRIQYSNSPPPPRAPHTPLVLSHALALSRKARITRSLTILLRLRPDIDHILLRLLLLLLFVYHCQLSRYNKAHYHRCHSRCDSLTEYLTNVL